MGGGGGVVRAQLCSPTAKKLQHSFPYDLSHFLCLSFDHLY